MQIVSKVFSNYGFVESKLDDDLYNILLKECNKKQKRMVSGLTDIKVPKHYFITDKKIQFKLFSFVEQLVKVYISDFPGYTANLNTLDRPCSLVYMDPWINKMSPDQFIPLHTHDGVFSYNIWIKIPTRLTNDKYNSNFVFNYSSSLGNHLNHTIKLSEEDEGKIILFPSILEHIVYPFSQSKQERFSIAGNIKYKGGGI